MHELRLAALQHPELCFWVKYNRARIGNLRVGDMAPNVPLRWARNDQKTFLFLNDNNDDNNNKATTTTTTTTTKRRCVILAGSWS